MGQACGPPPEMSGDVLVAAEEAAKASAVADIHSHLAKAPTTLCLWRPMSIVWIMCTWSLLFRTTSANAWAPKSNAELKAAIEECMKASADCSEGTHGPIESWDVSGVTDTTKLFKEAKFNGDLSKWDVSRVTTMEYMFHSASSFNADLSKWDVSKVTDKHGMRGMFFRASSFNADLSKWDVSKVTSMYAMFFSAKMFNGDLSNWDVSSVTTMWSMFYHASDFNADISKWDVSRVTTMYRIFYSASSFNADLSKWDVSKVTNMQRMFRFALSFDDDLSKWDVSKVRNMKEMFDRASKFKGGDLSKWVVSKVTDMGWMFYASSFNGDIAKWDVFKVTVMEGMKYMFSTVAVFNGDLSKWDVSRVTDMEGMFWKALSFNGDIAKWDVAKVTDMSSMFNLASSFAGDLSKWDVSKVTEMEYMFYKASSFNSDLSKWDISLLSVRAGEMFVGSLVPRICSPIWVTFATRMANNLGAQNDAFRNNFDRIDTKTPKCTGVCLVSMYYDGTDCAKCPKGRFGDVDNLQGVEQCRPCQKGSYGNARGLSKCHACPVGQFARFENQTTCETCAVGQHQTAAGRSSCDSCQKGFYGNASGLSKCHACPAGQFAPSEERTTCETCVPGQYQQHRGQSLCTFCELGTKYQDAFGQSSCKWTPKCKAGEFTAKPANLTSPPVCKPCRDGKFRKQGALSSISVEAESTVCHDTQFLFRTNKDRTDEEIDPLPVVLLIMIVVAALIFPIYKLVQLIIQHARAYKPQSKQDAALAKKFKLPKHEPKVQACIKAFKVQEKNLLRNGEWTEGDIQFITDNSNEVLRYLSHRVDQASDSQQIRIKRCCLKMDVLHDFKTLYGATMKNIRFKEREGFGEYMAVVSNMKNVVAKCKCPPNPINLVELYRSGRAVYDRFHAFIERAAKASDSGYIFKPHRKQAKMKGIYRVLEKGCFKYNHSWQDVADLDVSKVRDLVRGGIIDTHIAGISHIADFIFNSEEVTVCRVKDRFTESSGAGWTDLLLNFYMNDDENQHVCEVQLIHFKMLSQRTTQEGHGAYNIFRAASELLQHKDLTRHSSGQKKPRSLTHFKKTMSQPVQRTIVVAPHKGDASLPRSSSAPLIGRSGSHSRARSHDVSSVAAEGLQHGTLTQSRSTTNSRRKGRNPKVFPEMTMPPTNDEPRPNHVQDVRD